MTPEDYVAAARAPRSLFPWRAPDRTLAASLEILNGEEHAFLFDTSADPNNLLGYTIMDDSPKELRRHLPAILSAKGRVLKTGLGMGCFVRACLENPKVDHIDVVEIRQDIIDHFGAEFQGNPKVTIYHADAFKFPIKGKRWDLVWHDIYCAGNDGLQNLHARLVLRYRNHAEVQGAWEMPRWFKRLAGSKVRFLK